MLLTKQQPRRSKLMRESQNTVIKWWLPAEKVSYRSTVVKGLNGPCTCRVETKMNGLRAKDINKFYKIVAVCGVLFTKIVGQSPKYISSFTKKITIISILNELVLAIRKGVKGTRTTSENQRRSYSYTTFPIRPK